MSSGKGLRLDIQGLRALAVMAVVVFHISPNHLPGGFLGVDIFFVLSGYLIIGQIHKALQQGSFSLITFYSRRVLRLLPAMYLMVIVTSVFAYYLMVPIEFKKYVNSLFASLFYVSNFYFYFNSGYFDPSLKFAPLLHTWSLSVEEQFYLFFPLLMMFVFRKKMNVVAVVSILLIVFFVVSEILLQVDPSFAFYSSLSRFFQFLAGGLAGLYLAGRIRNPLLCDALSAVSLLTLIVCLFVMNGDNFPGLKALIPTVATVLLLSCQNPKGVIYPLLSNKLAVFIGGISYSVYLWHWPLIVFYNMNFQSINLYSMFFLLIGSALLGWVSFITIENYFRYKKYVSSRKVVLFSLLVPVLFLSPLFFISNVSMSSLDGTRSSYQSYLINYQPKNSRVGTCFLTSGTKDNSFDAASCIKASNTLPTALLLGDSHANHWHYGLEAHLSEKYVFSQVTATGCAPFLASSGTEHCTKLMGWFFNEHLKDTPYDVVIITRRWRAADVSDLQTVVKYMKSLGVKDVVVLGPTLEYRMDLPRLLIKHDSEEALATFNNYEQAKELEASIAKAAALGGARFVSVLDAVCTDRNTCDILINGVPLQFDYGHLTPEGSKHLVSKFKDFI